MIKTTIEQQCTVTSSKRVHLSERTNSGVPFYCSKEIIEKVNGSIPTETDFISEEQYTNIKVKFGVPQPDDLLLTTRGTIGVPYLYRKNDKFYFADGNLTWLKDFKSTLSSKYLYYWFQTKEARKSLEAISKGTAQQALSIEGLKKLSVRIPNIKVQNRVCEIISSYDDLIENNQKQIKLLEEAAQRLYKEWFVDLRFPGYEQTKIVDGLPEGWRNIVIGNLNCRLESGSRPKGGIDNSLVEGIPSIGAENVLGLGKYNYALEKLVSNDFFSNMKKGKIIDKDILIYKDGAYIGKTSLFQDSFPYKDASVNEHVFLLHTNNEMFQYYLFFTLYQSEYYMKMQKLNKNSAQPGINAKALLSLDLILPSSEIIGAFNQLVTPFVQQIFNKAKQNHKLEQARNRLLPKLMNGEIEI